MRDSQNTVKVEGKVYTPAHIVSKILSTAGLTSKDLSEGTPVICDPACGEGAFLSEIVRRIIKLHDEERAKKLLDNLYGFDINGEAVAECKGRLDKIVSTVFEFKVNWKLFTMDATNPSKLSKFNGLFTHVIANPPYVRIQNLGYKKQMLAGSWKVYQGASDLYIIFFEVGMSLLRQGGVLCQITPSSWLRSKSGAGLRNHLSENYHVLSVSDCGDHQMFPGVTTYVAITSIEKSRPMDRKTIYSRYDGTRFHKSGVIDTSILKDRWIGSKPSVHRKLRKMQREGVRLGDVGHISVGLQTLADRVFILEVIDKSSKTHLLAQTCKGETVRLERGVVRPIVKASVLREGRDRKDRVIIYPYDKEGRIVPEDQIFFRFPLAHEWLVKNRRLLDSRDRGRKEYESWYAYGRTVAILSGFKCQILTSGNEPQTRFSDSQQSRSNFLFRLRHSAQARHRCRKSDGISQFG